MKTLIVTNHSYMLYRFRKELIAELQKQGEVVISTPFVGHEDDLAAMGCRMIETALERRGIDPIKDIKLLKFYKKLIKPEKPDVVVTYSIKPNIYAGFVCRCQKIPYCVNVQGLGTAFQKEPIASLVTGMYKLALRKAKTVFFENDANKNEFTSRKIIGEEKCTVLSGAGVNVEQFSYCEYPKEELGIHFLYLGRIMKEKGMDEFFSAAKILKEKYGKSVIFDVVGFFEDEYEKLVNELAENGIINFYGFQTNPIPYYQQAHCVVLPSYHEGMSNVILEAEAIGRPVIVSDIPGCREAVVDGQTGFLCEKANTESLINAIEQYLSLSYEQHTVLSKNARIMVETSFDKKGVVAETTAHIL